MKKLVLAGLCLTFSSFAFSRNYDGCYQLLDTGVMYPAICISGTIEEGIDGANARLAIFKTNTDTLLGCIRSTALNMDISKFEFIINGRKELVLSHFSEDGISGDAMIGKTKLQFVRLSEITAQPLLDSAYRGNCL